MTVLGGSLFQFLVPLILAVAFLQAEDPVRRDRVPVVGW